MEHSTESTADLYQRFLHNTQQHIDSKKITPHKGQSKDVLLDMLRKVKDGTMSQYDFIYIDGSHLAKDVLVDAVLSWELLNIDGILIFDDYQWRDGNYCSPKPAIDGFLSSYKSMYTILHAGYQLHIRKIANDPKIIQ